MSFDSNDMLTLRSAPGVPVASTPKKKLNTTSTNEHSNSNAGKPPAVAGTKRGRGRPPKSTTAPAKPTGFCTKALAGVHSADEYGEGDDDENPDGEMMRFKKMKVEGESDTEMVMGEKEEEEASAVVAGGV